MHVRHIQLPAPTSQCAAPNALAGNPGEPSPSCPRDGAKAAAALVSGTPTATQNHLPMRSGASRPHTAHPGGGGDPQTRLHSPNRNINRFPPRQPSPAPKRLQGDPQTPPPLTGQQGQPPAPGGKGGWSGGIGPLGSLPAAVLWQGGATPLLWPGPTCLQHSEPGGLRQAAGERGAGRAGPVTGTAPSAGSRPRNGTARNPGSRTQWWRSSPAGWTRGPKRSERPEQTG